MTQCTDGSYDNAVALFDELLSSKCIKSAKYRKYKNTAQSQSHALKYLREHLEVCDRLTIFAGDQYGRFIRNQQAALDSLAEAGFLEKHGNGYCWPGAKEEKERLEREAEELRQKQVRQKAAYDEACAKVNGQIQEELSAATASISEEYDAKLRRIQREINEAVNEANRQRDGIQRQISDLRSQQSSLGFFKGKEKKALQVQIDEAQTHLNKIPSQQDIQGRYQPQITQINSEKQVAINKAKAEIQSQYIMPKLEDFAEV